MQVRQMDGPNNKTVIVNADDFGYNEETVDCTIRCFENGMISSATIMAGMPATRIAVDYAKKHPQFSFGVHLYFSDEKPISSPETIPSLVDPNTGHLWQTRSFLKRVILGKIRVSELAEELGNQYLQLAETGLPISHVDGHGHLHKYPPSVKALRQLKKRFGIKRCRRTQNLYFMKRSWRSAWINRFCQMGLGRLFQSPDFMLMTAGRTDDEQWFEKSLPTLPERGICEIGIHPGEAEKWRKTDSIACLNPNPELYSRNRISLKNYNQI